MVVIDLRSGSSRAAVPSRCDVCIVGAGLAGSAIAAELATTDLDTVLLESGDGSVRTPDRIAPSDEIDLATRSWVPHSAWPLTAAELHPYLERAARHVGLAAGIGTNADRLGETVPRARMPVSPDPDQLLVRYWQIGRDAQPAGAGRGSGRGAHRTIGPRQALVLGATVTSVISSDVGDRVDGVRWADQIGVIRELATPIVVLCAGGIDNPRILLNSTAGAPGGPGNAHDLIGRFLMGLAEIRVAEFTSADARRLPAALGPLTVGRHVLRAGFRLSPTVQRAEELLDVTVLLDDKVSRHRRRGALRRIVGVGERAGPPALTLTAICEQIPDPESRLTLGAEMDRWGVPTPVLMWPGHREEIRSVRRAAELMVAEFARMGLPIPRLLPWVRGGEDAPDDRRVDVDHPVGTTRMADDPRTGVVDVDGGLHGVDGLFVTGGSVLPTTGPGATIEVIVALALRTADAIRARHHASRVPQVSPVRPFAARRLGAPATRPLVLVTGATGRVGRHLVPELLARGYRVRAAGLRAPASSGPIEWIHLDLRTAGVREYRAAVGGCAAVVHLAASFDARPSMPTVNAGATGSLAMAAESAGVVTFCYISSVAVYGSPRRRDVDEESPVVTTEHLVPDEYLASARLREYGRTKLLGEELIRASAGSVRYTVLRPTVVVDVGDIVAIRSWSRLRRMRAASRHAHFVYVGDVADAITWTVARGLAGAAAPGAVEVFDLHDDDVPGPRYADFLRDAYAATGDRRFRFLPIPGIIDRINAAIRFRSRRHTFGHVRFRSAKLRDAGWRMPWGMAYARSEALDRLRSDRLGRPAGAGPPAVSTVVQAPDDPFRSAQSP